MCLPRGIESVWWHYLGEIFLGVLLDLDARLDTCTGCQFVHIPDLHLTCCPWGWAVWAGSGCAGISHLLGRRISLEDMDAIKDMCSVKVRNIFNVEENLRLAESKLKSLSCRASDYKQEVTKAEQTGKRKRKREVENWFEEVEQTEGKFNELKRRIQDEPIWKNLTIGDCMAEIDAKVEKLMEQSKDFEGQLWLDDHENRGQPLLVTENLSGKMLPEGWKAICDWLIKDDLFNIGIYGMGGVGKTTLAKYIHNHLLKETSFKVFWITISQNFSIRKLQDDIAKQVPLDLSGEDDENRRAAMLSRALANQSLLILDDVWEAFCPEQVGITLGANNCRLILTTRSLQVCDRMRCQRKFNVTTLDESEAWDLFRHTLGHEIRNFVEVEEIAKSVASRCDGLPLGIITVAGSMRGVVDIREWRTALRQLESCSIGYKEMEDKVFPILEWSFNRLDIWEKRCFLHCCLYPEDYVIKREQLFDLVIWAELIPMLNTREGQYDHGHTIVNKLVKVCLLEETKNYDGYECVRMHDLIRDMALRITSGKSSSKNTHDVPRFLVKSCMNRSNNLLIKNEEWIDGIFAISLFKLGSLEVPPLVSSNCRNLSTLIINDSNIREIPDSFLQHMYGLKVLNLEGCLSLFVLPKCISDMVNLRALLLGNCEELKSVPALGKLKQLRILNLFDTLVGDVPEGLEELVELERLYMSYELCERVRVLPEGTFSKLHRLQHLALPAAVHISDLGVMNGLQVYSGGLTSLADYTQLVTSGCFPRHYQIVIHDVCEDFDPFNYTRLENKLKFVGCDFQNRSELVSLPEDLHVLILKNCSGLSDDFFHQWTDRCKDLVALHILDSGELKFVLNFSSPDDDRLQKLRELSLCKLPNLVGFINWRFSGTFSSLEQLYIRGCHGLKKLFSVQLLQQSLQKLRKLLVNDCDELEEIVANNDDGGEATSSGPIASAPHLLLPSLEFFGLHSLPMLENVCDPNKTIMISNYGACFSFRGCPKLKRLPSIKITSGQPDFKIKGTEEWWNSLEWDNPTDKDALQPFFEVGFSTADPSLSLLSSQIRISQLISLHSQSITQPVNKTFIQFKL